MIRRELEQSVQNARPGSNQDIWASKLLNELTFAETHGKFEDRPVENVVQQTAKSEAAPKLDLRQITYDLLTKIRQPSDEEKEALGNVRYVFLPIEAKTLAQVVSEDPNYFWNGELDYINGLQKPDLREYVPTVMEVAFNPAQLFVPDSFGKSQINQLGMTEQYSQNTLETEFPDARVVILPASALAQADRAYFQKTGKVLFTNRFARALDQTSGVDAAGVGRRAPDYRLSVRDWLAGGGYDDVGAPLAVVFLENR